MFMFSRYLNDVESAFKFDSKEEKTIQAIGNKMFSRFQDTKAYVTNAITHWVPPTMKSGMH